MASTGCPSWIAKPQKSNRNGSRRRAAQEEIGEPPKIKMRSGQPPDRIVRGVLRFASSPLGGEMTASARQHLRSHEQPVPHLPKPAANPRSCDRQSAALRFAPAALSCSCSEEHAAGMGEEAATPGQPAALTRISGVSPGDSPSRITGLPLALPQSFGKLRTSHVFR
jgi:hypothetical protein